MDKIVINGVEYNSEQIENLIDCYYNQYTYRLREQCKDTFIEFLNECKQCNYCIDNNKYVLDDNAWTEKAQHDSNESYTRTALTWKLLQVAQFQDCRYSDNVNKLHNMERKFHFAIYMMKHFDTVLCEEHDISDMFLEFLREYENYNHYETGSKKFKKDMEKTCNVYIDS